VALVAGQGGVAGGREGQGGQDQAGQVEGRDRAADPGLRRVQGGKQAYSERSGDPLPGVEQRVRVAELVGAQGFGQGLEQRVDDQADGDRAAGQDERDQPQGRGRADQQQAEAGYGQGFSRR
jgi:hypothetical protein